MGGIVDLGALDGAVRLMGSEWWAWLWIVPGVLIGVVSGAIPGFSAAVAMVILLPVTVFMDFLSAVIFLTSIWTGGGFGAGIPSILLNVPGSPSAVATAFDGYPMTRDGRHNEALGIALAASVIGSAFSYLILVLLIDPIAHLVVKMGPTELLVVMVWGLTLVAALSQDGLVKGLFAAVFGVMLGTVGSSLMGDFRGTMGIPYLMEGIPVIPALVGMFAISEMLLLVSGDHLTDRPEHHAVGMRRILNGVAEAFKHPIILIRGSMIGACIGAVPGVGAAIANLMSYHATRRRSREPESFGRGNPQGVVAAESANSSSEGGSMATMLVFGIPGSGGTAVMLGAFALHNITAGPNFFAEQKATVYAILLANVVEAIALLVIGLAFVRFASRIVRVPVRYLVPAVLSATIVGAYFITENMAGPVTVVVFGAIGFVMRKYGYPVAATVIGLLIGNKVEFELGRSLQISGGEIGYLAERPFTLILLLVMLASIFAPGAIRLMRNFRGKRPSDGASG